MTFEDERFLDELVDKLCDRLDRIVVALSDLRKEQSVNTSQIADLQKKLGSIAYPSNHAGTDNRSGRAGRR